MKTPMQEFITFISSEDYKKLYPSLKIEWFEIFLNKEKELIKDTFEWGELVNERSERYDNCTEDNDFNSWKEYYNHKFGNTDTNPTTQTEKEIIKDHLDAVVNRYITHERDVDALPYFIKQFEEEITDTWSALDILKYLKDNDFQIL